MPIPQLTQRRLTKIFYGENRDIKFLLQDYEKFKDVIKEQNINIRPKDLKDWYEAQEVVQVTKPPPLTKESDSKQKFHYKIITDYPFQRFYLDTMYIKKYGIAILCGLDQFSRYAFCKLFSNTYKDTGISSSKVLEAFKIFQKSIEKQFNYFIMEVYTDEGPEFKGSFQNYLSKEEIPHIVSNPLNPHKNANIERFNGTLRLLIEKYKITFGGNITQNVLDIIVEAYNENEHSSLKNPPIEIVSNLEKAKEQYLENQIDKEINYELPEEKILPNDTFVRYYIRHQESFKKKGKNWSKIIFQIEGYDPMTKTYILKDLEDKFLQREFLQVIDKPKYDLYNAKITKPIRLNENRQERNMPITRDDADVINQPIQNQPRQRRQPQRLQF